MEIINDYFIGRYSISKDKELLIIQKIKKKLKKKVAPGIIPFKKPEDFTPEAIADKKLEDQWRKSGFDKKLENDII